MRAVSTVTTTPAPTPPPGDVVPVEDLLQCFRRLAYRLGLSQQKLEDLNSKLAELAGSLATLAQAASPAEAEAARIQVIRYVSHVLEILGFPAFYQGEAK